LDHDPDVFLKLINYLRMVDQKSRADIDVPVPEADFKFCWLLEYYGLMLSIYPPQWYVTQGTDGATIQKPSRPDDPFVLKATHQSSFALRLEQKPDMCASLLIVFEKGSTGASSWGSGIAVSITRSEQDQRVKMLCTYEVAISTYFYSVQLEDLDPVTWQTTEENKNVGPIISLSGSVVVSGISYLFV
jgi:hypothetical protein